MKKFSLIIASALLTISASAPVQVATADAKPAVIEYAGSAGYNL